MGAGFYRHDTESGGCCRVGNEAKGGSFNRSEHAASCIAQTNTSSPTPNASWIGEGYNPIIKMSPDGDIFRDIIELLRRRMELGLFTLFVKIRAHRGEP